MLRSIISALSLLVVGASILLADKNQKGGTGDWPQFRGPNGTGIATDAKPPLKWTEKDGVKWKTPLPGPGSSSPIVLGDRVFVTCYSGYGVEKAGSVEKLKRHLVCLDRTTGKVRWTADVAAVTPEDSYRGYITEHGYGPEFVHGTGHGVGLQIHELPWIRKDFCEPLQVGEVVTVEPGVYRRGLGGVRIEDLVLVTPTGHRIITQSQKDNLCLQSPRTT